MNTIKRVIACLASRYRWYAEWYESLPPDVQAEILRNQNRLL